MNPHFDPDSQKPSAGSALADAFNSRNVARNVDQHPRKKKRRQPPFSIRLSRDERVALEEAAGDQSLGAYVRQILFAQKPLPRSRRAHRPVVDHTELAQVLAMLGQSRLSSNLNQVARAANLGVLPVTPDLEASLAAAVADIRTMRQHLLRALGFAEAGRNE